jgi:pimeloyl-ACP methyl ester carboxylesterase
MSAAMRVHPLIDEAVLIGPQALPGTLVVPPQPRAAVIFAHGSGSSRLSPRNVDVAQALQREQLGTLLFDLLTPAEAEDRRNVFDIALLAERLQQAMDFLRGREECAALPLQLFGASTGAAAALVAAAQRPDEVAAVVSRGGRPDLAGDALRAVRAPTLLIVGGEDHQVLALNESAHKRMTCHSELVVIPRATHLFEEPGTLDEVARFAAQWFVRHAQARAAHR